MSFRRRAAAAVTGGLTVALVVLPRLPAEAAVVPSFDHIFTIVMENHSYSEIIGSSAAPYINSLAASGALATTYYAVTHPSLPNYLASTGASTFNVASDCTTCWISATNLADRIESAGKTWKTYMESMPSACYIGDSPPYYQKHNPFIYFNDIRTNTARCQSHIVPYSQLSADLSSTATTPGYAFIAPNICNDMHDCSVQTGDSWLRQQVPLILASPAFKYQRSLLALTWDEDDASASNHVPLILVGYGTSGGLQSRVSYNHYSLVHTIEAGLGLNTLTANDAGASLMTDLFTTVSPSPSPSPSPPPTSPVWSASYSMSPPTAWVMGQTKTVSVTLTNTGNQTWPSGGSNPVKLDMHFTTTTGGSAHISSWKTSQIFSLPSAVAPSASVTVGASVTAPSTRGAMYLEAELFKNQQFWFTQTRATAVTVYNHWQAKIDISAAPPSWAANQTRSFNITLTNVGDQTWPSGSANPVRLDINFSTTRGGSRDIACCWKTSQIFNLPGDVAPGGSTTFGVAVTAPSAGGSYYFEAQLFRDHLSWFPNWTYKGVTVAAPVWRASYSMIAPIAWRAGQTQSVSVTLTNTGNQTWPSGTSHPVRLDINFSTSSGGSAVIGCCWKTSQVFVLPGNVAPGASVTLTVSATAPSTPGSYFVEAQLFKNQQFWFRTWTYAKVTVS